MKVYIATSGEYSDYAIRRVFTRLEDAEAYPLADDVEEWQVTEGPVEVRPRYYLTWNPGLPDRATSSQHLANPYVYPSDQDFNGNDRDTSHKWDQMPLGPVLHVEGWDRDRVMKTYSEQRARHIADHYS